MKVRFISFPAADYPASQRFYEEAVGLVPLRRSEEGPHRFTNYDLGGPVLKLFEWTEPWHGSGHSGLFIETEDLDGTVENILSAGHSAPNIVVHAWGGRCATVKDPFGNLFDLIDAGQVGDS